MLSRCSQDIHHCRPPCQVTEQPVLSSLQPSAASPSQTGWENVPALLHVITCCIFYSSCTVLSKITPLIYFRKSLTGEAVQTALSHHCHQAVCKLQKGKSDSSNTELAKPELWLAYQRVREGWDLLAPSALQVLKSSCLTGLYLRYKWKNSNPGDSNIHCRNFTAQRTKPIRKPFWQLHYFSAGINDQWFHLWKAEIRLKCFSPDPKGREDDDCSSLRNGTDFLYSCTAQFSIPDLINTTGLSFSSMCTPPTETSGLCSTSVKKKIYEMLGCFLVVLVIGRTTRFDVIWQPQNFLET